jgi:hypothetical protein
MLELHDEIGSPRRTYPRVDDGHGVRVANSRRGPSLAKEASHCARFVGDVRVQHLDGNRFAELLVDGFENGRHSSRTDAPPDSIRAQPLGCRRVGRLRALFRFFRQGNHGF